MCVCDGGGGGGGGRGGGNWCLQEKYQNSISHHLLNFHGRGVRGGGGEGQIRKFVHGTDRCKSVGEMPVLERAGWVWRKKTERGEWGGGGGGGERRG